MKIHLEVHPYLTMPDQTPATVTQLRRNLERDGKARDAVLYWKNDGHNWIVDGKTRWELCSELGLPFTVQEMQFASIHEAKRWMIDLENGRRRQSDEDIAVQYAEQKRDEERAQEKAIKTSVKQGDPAPSVTKFTPKATVVEKAKEAGVDRTTMSRAVKLVEQGTPELIKAVKSGEIPLKEASKMADEPPSRQRQAIKRGQKKAPQPKPAANTKDEMGNELPVDLLEHFAARATFDELLGVMTKLSTLINPLLGDPQANKKPIPGGERMADSRTEIKQLIERLRGYITINRPYVPCHLSHKIGKCPGCGGCGWMTKKAYENSGIK